MGFVVTLQWLGNPSVWMWRNLRPGTVAVAGGSEDAGDTEGT